MPSAIESILLLRSIGITSYVDSKRRNGFEGLHLARASLLNGRQLSQPDLTNPAKRSNRFLSGLHLDQETRFLVGLQLDRKTALWQLNFFLRWSCFIVKPLP
jgi:hypothetical protein